MTHAQTTKDTHGKGTDPHLALLSAGHRAVFHHLGAVARWRVHRVQEIAARRFQRPAQPDGTISNAVPHRSENDLRSRPGALRTHKTRVRRRYLGSRPPNSISSHYSWISSTAVLRAQVTCDNRDHRRALLFTHSRKARTNTMNVVRTCADTNYSNSLLLAAVMTASTSRTGDDPFVRFARAIAVSPPFLTTRNKRRALHTRTHTQAEGRSAGESRQSAILYRSDFRRFRGPTFAYTTRERRKRSDSPRSSGSLYTAMAIGVLFCFFSTIYTLMDVVVASWW